MATYITVDKLGSITAFADFEFPGSTQVNFDVVRGCDGKLYKSGDEPQGPTIEEKLLAQLRSIRDVRLDATDKYLLSDYPISAIDLVAIKTYRQLLRDLPSQEGSPWDGGGSKTPWPVIPKL